METVGNFPDLASARVVQSLLEAEGIEAQIPDEYFSGVDWQMNTALRGVRVTVARRRRSRPGDPCRKRARVVEDRFIDR